MSSLSTLMECTAGLNGTLFDLNYKGIILDFLPGWAFALEGLPWFWAMIGSILVGLSGVLPLLVIPIDQTHNLKQGASANFLKTLLSFAVGGLLGDVFLHSLPEIWANGAAQNGGVQTKSTGGLILCGLLVFVGAEKIFSVIQKLQERNSFITAENNNLNKKHVSGYLNLLSNTIDNFTHGLSLGGAFLVSLPTGFLTTFAILIHEIPHEVGDFAILLKSGFSRFDATVYQIMTAGGGLIGSFAAVMFSGASARTSWILPFTAGTFLHIALVTVLPDLLKEEDPKESLKQLCTLILGIIVMAVVTAVCE